MNIRLIPFTWIRHVSIGLFVGGTAIMAWWICVNWISLMPSSLVVQQFYEGALFDVHARVGDCTHDDSRRGHVAPKSAPMDFGPSVDRGALRCPLFTALFVFGWDTVLATIGAQKELVDEPSLGGSATAGLTYRLAGWVICGVASGFAVYASRLSWFLALKLRSRFEEKIPKFIALPHEYGVLPKAFDHLFGGLAAGLISAALWHALSYIILGDFYLASALGFMSMGFCFGTLVWGIPPDLYSGWFRVLSEHRYGHRLPILSSNENFGERFIGHFPRGLNLYVEHQHGVAEIHASFVGDETGRYAVRGLTQSPTVVKRF